MNYYVLWIWGDVEPELIGPFKTEEERDAEAKKLHAKEGDEGGIYWMDCGNGTSKPEVGSYTGGFFEEE